MKSALCRYVHPAGLNGTLPQQGVLSGVKPIFVFTAATESRELVLHSLRLAKRAYPQASIVLILDQPRPDLMFGGLRCVQGKTLKVQSEGGAWWHRFFEEGLREPGDVIFNVDPDTRIARKLSYVPDFDCFGSHLGPGHCQEHIQGGFQGFWRSSAEVLCASRVFLQESLKDWHNWAWAQDYHFGWGEKKGYLSTDRLIMVGLKKLGLTWGNHDEVMSMYRASLLPADLSKWAVTHPHKSVGGS
jgi:hypothetical protein